MKRNTKKYYKHKIENLLHISKIVTMHYLDLYAGFKSDGESHDFWEMVYADRNAIICERDGEELLIKEGEAIFHKPNEYHIHKTSEDESASIFIISFVSTSPAISYFEGKVVPLDRELTKYVYMIIEEGRRTFDLRHSDEMTKRMPLLDRPSLGGMQVIKNLTEALLINIMREGDGDRIEPMFIVREDFGEYITGQVVDFLQENVRESISIDDICKKLNYARSYLFKHFKAVTGETIMSYFLSLKIKEAKRMLLETDMSVTEIANELSFDTPNYFSKAFKRISGYTPLEYRRVKRTRKLQSKKKK